MSAIDARVSEQLCRLQSRTRMMLRLCLAGTLAALAVCCPLAWWIARQAMLAPASATSFLLRSTRGDVTVQQTLPAGTDGFHLFFTVSTSEGAPVRSLDVRDLEVFTDEVGPVTEFSLSAASSTPLALFVAVDTGSSMAVGRRLTASAKGLVGWLRVLAPEKVALVSFNNLPRVEETLTSDFLRFDRALERLSSSGETALFDAVVFAADRAFDRDCRKALVLVTNGNDTASKTRLADATMRVRSACLPVFGVTVGEPSDRTAVETLARDSGGRAFHAPDAGALVRSLSSISDWLASQYVLWVPARLPRAGAATVPGLASALVAAMVFSIGLVLGRWLRAPRLVILGGPKNGLAIPLTSEILICGSDPGCHLQVPGDLHSSSGRRFAVERRGGTVSFHRFDPSGSTTVNRMAVESRDLISGDLIRAGMARFLFFRYEAERDFHLDLPGLGSLQAARIKDPFWLVSEDGGPTFHIDGERMRVGREPDNGIVLEDPSVSRRHAEFVHSAEGWSIADLGSRNGTYLGASRVASEAPVVEGARLRFGRIRFSLSLLPPGEEYAEIEVLTEPEPLAMAAPPAPPVPAPVGPAPGPQPDPAPLPQLAVPGAPSSETSAPEVPAPPAEAPASGPVEAAPAVPPEVPAPVQPPAVPVPGDGASQTTEPLVTCPICSHVNRPRARYCTQCGEKLAGESEPA